MGVFAKDGLQPTLLDVEICPRPVTYVVWSNCLVAFVELQAMVAAKKFGLDVDDFTGDALHHVAENIQAKKFQNEGGVKRAVWNLARGTVAVGKGKPAQQAEALWHDKNRHARMLEHLVTFDETYLTLKFAGEA